MNDDYAGDITTTGRLQINGSPLTVNSDFEDDADWFLVSTFRKFYDYRISVFLPPDGFDRIYGDVRVGVYDAGGNPLRDGTQPFRTQHDYTHAQNSGSRFVGIQAENTGFYRTQVLEADITGDTRETSRIFEPNFGQWHAGSITAADDSDMFRMRLRAGINYQINLLGNSSNENRDTTLGDPILRLFDGDTLITTDNDSGAGTNARISFTPTETKTYYVDVQGNGTQGTYLLGIPDADDYIGSTETTARLQLNQKTPGRLDWEGDEDWFRFNVDAGFTYLFGVNEVRLYDLDGTAIDANARQYQPETAKEIFVAVKATGYDWSLTPRYRDDYSATTFGVAKPLPSGNTIGAIEDSEDFDLFSLDLPAFAFHEFKLEAYGNRPLTDARITTYDTEGNLLQSYNAGSTVTLRRFGNSTDPAYISVDSIEDNIGAWRLTRTPRDRAAGDTSTKWNVQFNEGRGFIRNALDFQGDVDFHRVRMLRNTWYEVDWYSGADLSIQRPNGAEVKFKELVSNGDKSYFYATQTGDHYIAARPLEPENTQGSYFVSLRQNAAFQSIHDATIPQWINTSYRRTANLGLPVEVYSEIPLVAGDVNVEAGELTTLTDEQWNTLATADSLDRAGDIYIRGVLGNGQKQDWSKIGVTFPPFSQIRSSNFQRSVRYAFVDSLPAEYANDEDFTGFEELTENEQEIFALVAERWSRFAQASIVPDDDYEMQVFKVALGEDEPLLAFAPGEGRGHDIILNSSSDLFSSRSHEGSYHLLQAMGTSMGLNTIPDLDRSLSVMGTAVTPGQEDEYPWAPQRYDDFATRNTKPGNTNPSSSFNNEYIQLNGTEPLYRTADLRDTQHKFRYSISATGSEDPVTIDLRSGSKSFVRDSDVAREVENGPAALLVDGLGGFKDDRLFGNHLSNRLSGYGGSDVIHGDSGNDRLEGGRGDDYYIFRPASHQDVITESGRLPGGERLPSGGLDVIRIEGMYDYDSIQEDLTFSRLGNDLLIRLELDGRFNVNGDGIRVTDMHDPEKRVEALSLLNPSGFVDRISLVSVFEQAGANRRRFEVLSATDDYGSLVQPV